MNDFTKQLAPTRRRQYLWGICGSLIGALIVFCLYTILTANDNAQEAVSSSQDNTQLLAIVKDCVDPNGRCYKKARAQRLQTVADINQMTAYAVACSSRLPYGLTVKQKADRIGDCMQFLTRTNHKPRPLR